MQETKEQPAAPQTKRITGIQFSRAGKIEFYLANGAALALHDLVVVKNDQEEAIGTVIIPPRDVPGNEVATNIKAVIRKATPGDMERHNQDMEDAKKAFSACEEKILEGGLPMKLVDVTIEGKKAIFFFFAEERVDFRALVKDLAKNLHVRIEMRQIGARDEAKGIGAIGPCGLVCCCETYLRDFTPISISMAKNQGFSPNPAKLTGMCGKLKCCLAYENQLYLDGRRDLPPIGTSVETQHGRGVITNLDVLRHLCHVHLDNPDKDEEVRINCSECKVLERPKKAEKEEREKGYEEIEG